MDSIRKRVFNQIFFAPSVVLPIVAGASALLFSWAIGGSILLSTLGVVGVLGGIGWMATRAIFQIEAITERTVLEMRQKVQQAENAALDALMRDLHTDRDFRTEDYLILLRTIRSDFEETARQPGVEIRSREVVLQVRQLFAAAVQQLRQSLKLWELSERLNGEDRKDVIAKRESVLAEVKQSIDHLKSATEQYQVLMQREQHADLSELRDELDTSLRVAKRTEERMREFDSKPDYETYIKE